ncbi:hypothetical protein QE152_g9316 [Popillia japonica]|uniref:Uncharacterized protein n=1 Tax=Popillia japonica TaxID=7064 RepID=A0AAW1LZI6_POPJA
MDIKQVLTLRNLHSNIVHQCHFQMLLPHLMEHVVFSREDYPLCHKDCIHLGDEILFVLPTKGPQAFNYFVRALEETKQNSRSLSPTGHQTLG